MAVGMVGSLIPAVISRLAFLIWQAMDIEGGDGKHRSTSFTKGGVYPTWIDSATAFDWLS